MERKPFDIVDKARSTRIKRDEFAYAAQTARNLAEDPHKDLRHASRQCEPCFYISRVSGRAVTKKACSCCGEMQTYPSTSVDVLCVACSEKWGACKHCGGELDLGAPTP